MARERKDLNRRLSKSCNLKQQQKYCSFLVKEFLLSNVCIVYYVLQNIIHRGRVKNKKKVVYTLIHI